MFVGGKYICAYPMKRILILLSISMLPLLLITAAHMLFDRISAMLPVVELYSIGTFPLQYIVLNRTFDGAP